jgi:tRNA pseudouridine38-40 synthase
MPRYFLEISYKGTAYSGFQAQENANTIQAEVERSFAVLHKEKVSMTGSSRTDAGVHAKQNFFHFDFYGIINPHFIYKINAILPKDIVVKSLLKVKDSAHCRFDAVSREYEYHIYRQKDPFLEDRAYYFPFKLDTEKLHNAAAIIKEYTDFSSFSKRNSQVKTFNCNILESKWLATNNILIYNVKANRFLRGMVRALTATMLLVGRNKITIEEFKEIIASQDCTKANFATPSHGLFLKKIEYPEEYFFY